MRLIVFGATGQTGLAVLKLATNREGLEVSAFVRTPSKIPQDVRRNLSKIVSGDVLNPGDVTNALEGQDAVISCLGTPLFGGLPKLMSRGIENVVNGMRENGVKRLALVGSAGFLPGDKNFLNTYIIQNLASNHGEAMKFLETVKDVDWAIVMPPFITAATQVGNYKTAFDKLPGSAQATTHDIADWMINCVQDSNTMKENAHRFIGISTETTSTFPTGKLAALCLLIGLCSLYYYYS